MEDDGTRAGGNGNQCDKIGGIVNDENGGLVGKTAVDNRVAGMGVGGDEAVVQIDGHVTFTEIVRKNELVDIATHTFFLVAGKIETPQQEHHYDGKHCDKQYGCPGKKGFVGIFGFSHRETAFHWLQK